MTPSFVYLAQLGDDGPVKIGTSKDPAKRISTMSTGSPRTIRLLATRTGDRELEARIHEWFAPYRIRGEWFEPRAAIFADFGLPFYRPRTYGSRETEALADILRKAITEMVASVVIE